MVAVPLPAVRLGVAVLVRRLSRILMSMLALLPMVSVLRGTIMGRALLMMVPMLMAAALNMASTVACAYASSCARRLAMLPGDLGLYMLWRGEGAMLEDGRAVALGLVPLVRRQNGRTICVSR